MDWPAANLTWWLKCKHSSRISKKLPWGLMPICKGTGYPG